MRQMGIDEKELKYEDDQLTDRIMVKEMGKGLRSTDLSFDNPIIVTRRYDELLLGPANFTNYKKAKD